MGCPPHSPSPTRFTCAAGLGIPPSFPPLVSPRVKCALPFEGLLSLSSFSGMACDRSTLCPVPSPIYVAFCLWSSAPLVAPWPYPLTWVPARPPAPPAPVSRTRDTVIFRFWTWHCRRHQSACAGSPRCLHPPPCPAVVLAEPLSLAHSSLPHRCRWLCAAPLLR